jgi:DeoR family transcriptional regulator of aga operon
MFTDKLFFGANGIHVEHGVTDRHTEEAAMNEAMVRQARQRIVVADHTKFRQIARCLVCPIQAVNTIITDTSATDEMIAPFLDLGIEVLRV